MTTELIGLENTRSKVETFLREKKLSYQVRPNNILFMRHESTGLFIETLAHGKITIVKLLCPVALKIKNISPELTLFLAKKNNEHLWGKFSLDANNSSIFYEHVLLGDYLDSEELIIAIVLLLETANKYDEEIAKLSGGVRFVDL